MTVAQFIKAQPPRKLEMMTILRSWIFDLGAQTKEGIRDNIPHFHLHGDLCYLNPTEEGVDLGFVKGYELPNEHGLLESNGRKHTMSITFHSVAEVEEHEETVRQILNEAAILNEFQARHKSPSSKK